MFKITNLAWQDVDRNSTCVPQCILPYAWCLEPPISRHTLAWQHDSLCPALESWPTGYRQRLMRESTDQGEVICSGAISSNPRNNNISFPPPPHAEGHSIYMYSKHYWGDDVTTAAAWISFRSRGHAATKVLL